MPPGTGKPGCGPLEDVSLEAPTVVPVLRNIANVLVHSLGSKEDYVVFDSQMLWMSLRGEEKTDARSTLTSFCFGQLPNFWVILGVRDENQLFRCHSAHLLIGEVMFKAPKPALRYPVLSNLELRCSKQLNFEPFTLFFLIVPQSEDANSDWATSEVLAHLQFVSQRHFDTTRPIR